MNIPRMSVSTLWPFTLALAVTGCGAGPDSAAGTGGSGSSGSSGGTGGSTMASSGSTSGATMCTPNGGKCDGPNEACCSVQCFQGTCVPPCKLLGVGCPPLLRTHPTFL